MPDSNTYKDLLQKPLFHGLLIIAICLIAYSNTFNAPFHFDDSAAIVKNPIIKDLGFMINPSTAKDLKGGYGYELFQRRYVGYLTFALNYRVHKLDASGYHLVNLCIHIINALIVYWLVLLTFRTPFMNSSTLREHSSRIALFTSLFFACHPVQTQAVNYIWQRVAILSTTFYCLSLVMYIKWRLASKKNGSASSRTHIFLYFGSVLLAVLAMKTKETAFTLPVVILLYELMFFDGKLKKRFLYLVPLVLTMFIIPASLLWVDTPTGGLISDVGEATRVYSNMPRWDYLFTQFAVIVTYIRLILLPGNQNLDYDYPVYDTFLTPEVFLSFLVLLGIFGYGIYLFMRSKNRNSTFRLIAFGIFWFFITLSVESSFIPLANVIFEHRIYLPSLGIFTAFTAGIFLQLNTFEHRHFYTIGVTILMAIIIVFSIFTYSRNKVWSSEVSLWQDCVEKSPQKARPHNNLGFALYNQGDIERAIYYYQRSLRIQPDYALAHNNLGIALAEKEKPALADFHFKRALQLDPGSAAFHYNTGVFLARHNGAQDAMAHFAEAIKADPGYAEAYNNIGVILNKWGRHKRAGDFFRKAVQLDPDYIEALRNLEHLGRIQGSNKPVSPN